ncbi:MAG: VWA domain-containing protein [Verrucomicrobia bacterium]|nr:VWA domain-containing protein [Verrucomicrobiota bacterium]
MSFHQPAVLWLLALPVAWGYWQWTRRGHPLVLPFDYGSQRAGRRWRVLVNGANTLPALLLAIAVLVLAGPRRPAPPANERILNNILLCLDVSGSMSMRLGNVTRFEAAMASARQFCEYRQGDAFGLTIFGTEYLHWFPPTKELSAIRNALPFVQPARRLPWFGGTLIGHALAGCKERLARTKEGDRAIILISDAGSGDFSGGRDRQIAQELADARIRVFTILIGSDTFGVDGVYTIAAITGGKVFRAEDPAALEAIFREIDQMQKARFKPLTSDWVDAYAPLSMGGLAAASLWALTLLGLRYTPW